jgi:hypothetical protein
VRKIKRKKVGAFTVRKVLRGRGLCS